jgi:osmotically-inducible protein OsmY
MPKKIIEERHDEIDPDIGVDPRVDPRYRERRVDPVVPAKRSWYSRREVSGRRGPSFLPIFFILLLAGLTAAGFYYYYYGDRSLSSDINTLSENSKDAATTAAVKTSLSLNKQLVDDSINVDTTNNVVTLNGEVNSIEDKKLAEELARSTRGVGSVVNNLAITTAGRTEQRVEDLEVQTKVLEALFSNDSLRGQEIKARVEDKVVILEGKVDTQEHKDIAVSTARRISGVREVKDENLKVNFVQPPATVPPTTEPPTSPLKPVQ